MSPSDLESLILSEFRGRVRSDREIDTNRTPLAELGIDSLDFFEGLMNLEEKLGYEIPIDDLEADMTLASLCRLVEAAGQKA